MSQLVFRMRGLLKYCSDHGLNSVFKDNLRECVQLTGGVTTENDIDGHTHLARDVARNLDLAYKALHTEVKHQLPYDRYEAFMQVCRGWGALVGNDAMTKWRTLTEEEYTQPGGAQPTQPTQQAGGGGAAETRGPHRMQELLAKLQKLLEEFAEG